MATLDLNPAHYTASFLDESCGAQLLATAIVFIVLEVFVYTLRFWCRRRTRVPWGNDDYLISAGLLANIAQCTLSAVMVTWAGVGTHLIANIFKDPSRLRHEAQGLLIMEWTYGLAVCLPKLAILELYLRIFLSRSFRMACYVTIGIVVATFVATGLTATFQCTPIAFQWDKNIKDGYCIDELAFFRWCSLPNVITDVVLLVLPIPIVLRLHATTQKKLELVGIFVCGSAGLIFSIVRFSLFFKTDAFADETWTSSILMVVTDIEPAAYFICACLPGLRPLLEGFRNRATTSRQTGPSSGSGSSAKRSTADSHNGFRQPVRPLRGKKTQTEVALETFDDDGHELLPSQRDVYNIDVGSVSSDGVRMPAPKGGLS